jgi:hypothetical protein
MLGRKLITRSGLLFATEGFNHADNSLAGNLLNAYTKQVFWQRR